MSSDKDYKVVRREKLVAGSRMSMKIGLVWFEILIMSRAVNGKVSA